MSDLSERPEDALHIMDVWGPAGALHVDVFDTLLGRLRAAEAVCEAGAPIYDAWMAHQDEPDPEPDNDIERALLAMFRRLVTWRKLRGER